MAYVYKIFHDLHLVYKEVTAVYDDEQAQLSSAELQEKLQSGDFTESYRRLFDLTGVAEYIVSMTMIRRMADYWSVVV